MHVEQLNSNNETYRTFKTFHTLYICTFQNHPPSFNSRLYEGLTTSTSSATANHTIFVLYQGERSIKTEQGTSHCVPLE